MTDDEIISVVQAHKEGKKIEVCDITERKWDEMQPREGWAFHRCNYRVAPEPRKPREWTLAIDTQTGHVFRARENKLEHPNFENEFVHVREVI